MSDRSHKRHILVDSLRSKRFLFHSFARIGLSSPGDQKINDKQGVSSALLTPRETERRVVSSDSPAGETHIIPARLSTDAPPAPLEAPLGPGAKDAWRRLPPIPPRGRLPGGGLPSTAFLNESRVKSEQLALHAAFPCAWMDHSCTTQLD